MADNANNDPEPINENENENNEEVCKSFKVIFRKINKFRFAGADPVCW